MKIAARMAVARDSAVVAPRAPNTVPEAPEPKPAPASAPLPRCSSTSSTMAMAENNCTNVKIRRNIAKTASSRSGSGQDCQELIRLQRGATDQTAVDIRHREQLVRIAGLHAASIENARGGSDSSIPRPDTGADELVHILRLLGCGVATGADRPHRFVGHHAQLECAGTAQFQHHIELAGDHFVSAPGVAIRQLLAHAQDRYQALGVRRAKLARHQLIALAIQQAPLGVADDHVFAAYILEHGGRDLTGERALRVRADILATETEHRAAHHPPDFL